MERTESELGRPGGLLLSAVAVGAGGWVASAWWVSVSATGPASWTDECKQRSGNFSPAVASTATAATAAAGSCPPADHAHAAPGGLPCPTSGTVSSSMASLSGWAADCLSISERRGRLIFGIRKESNSQVQSRRRQPHGKDAKLGKQHQTISTTAPSPGFIRIHALDRSSRLRRAAETTPRLWHTGSS